jgi:hypothetical protein
MARGGNDMSIPDSLAVRLFSPSLSMDQYITNQVEGLTFRHVIPGGCAAGSLKVRRYNPIGMPDIVIWTPTTSGASIDAQTFQVTDANAANINVGDRFWVYSSGSIRFNGDRFRVLSKSSTSGITTVTYSPASSGLIASGDTVLAKVAATAFSSDVVSFNKLITLFNRVQVIDVRTAECAWEGRIEDPARETEKNVWTIGCLGTTVFASDINRPMFYLDEDVGNVITVPGDNLLRQSTIDNEAKIVTVNFTPGFSWPAGGTSANLTDAGTWQGIERCDLEGVARVDYDSTGNDDASVTAKLGCSFDTNTYSGSSTQSNIGNFRFSDAPAHKTRIIGTDITATDVHRIILEGGYIPNTGSDSVAGQSCYGQFKRLRFQPQRMDRFRNMLTTAASYPNRGVLPSQIVEDVLGRFLNGGHYRSSADIPYWGYVDPYSAYVDVSSSIKMVSDISWMDGAIAKDILDKICTDAQTNAYWAIWESNFLATDDGFDAKCKFEYATWPGSWGYTFTSEDGLTEQPTAEDEYNFLWYQFSYDTDLEGIVKCQTFWHGDLGTDLDTNGITRGQTVRRDQDVSSGSTEFNEADQWVRDNSKSTNSGSITIKRPVHFLDKGLNSNGGAARYLDPWMIRPGKLCRIIDLPAMAMMGDIWYGNVAPNRVWDSVILRVVDTEYNSDDNSVTCSLDEVAKWSVPKQIVTKQRPAPPVKRAYR